MSDRSIFITGSSTGLGKAAAKLFAAKGWRVLATMRQPDKETELESIAGRREGPAPVHRRRGRQGAVRAAQGSRRRGGPQGHRQDVLRLGPSPTSSCTDPAAAGGGCRAGADIAAPGRSFVVAQRPVRLGQKHRGSHVLTCRLQVSQVMHVRPRQSV